MTFGRTRGHGRKQAHFTTMDFEVLQTLRKHHPAWRLLAADHAPFVASFLFRAFTKENARTHAEGDLVALLDDHLFDLRRQTDPDASPFPKRAIEYLDEWASDAKGWLRKFYPPGSDEPHFDLTPSAERALAWLATLRQRQFVGTESRLLTVFALLREIVQETSVDPALRIAELERRRNDIDAEIARIAKGEVSTLDDAQVKDRFLQMAGTAQGLLADFREVEENFRALDRNVRERINAFEGSKGELLSDIFGARDEIGDSDQGKSFRAFWDFLMSPARQEELSALLQAVFVLPAVQSLDPPPRLLRVHHDWLQAGESTQRTVARLSAQLRRYLDERAAAENRRIVQILRGIEHKAVALRDHAPSDVFYEIDDTSPEAELPMDRLMYSPPWRPRLQVQISDDSPTTFDTGALYNQHHVDRERLKKHIRRLLQTHEQVSLAQVLSEQALSQGLAELVTYLDLAATDAKAVIDDGTFETIQISDGALVRSATVPLVIFCR